MKQFTTALSLCVFMLGVCIYSFENDSIINQDQTINYLDIDLDNRNLETASSQSSEKKVQQQPQMNLMSPMERYYREGNITKPGVGPCEGVHAEKVHFMSTPASRNFIMWDIAYPAEDANCTVLFGTSPKLHDFTTLYPLDNSADEYGKFPCGRQTTDLAQVEVKFPPSITCENCILSMKWDTKQGTQYHCADISVAVTSVSECSGLCLNGGVCMGGKCQCDEGFSGNHCQQVSQEDGTLTDTLNDDSGSILWLFVLILIIICIVVLIFVMKDQNKKQEQQNLGGDDDADMTTNQKLKDQTSNNYNLDK